jgi:ribosomal protein L37AE/L43A
MSDRFNCPVHGLQLVDNYNDGCPQCRFAEEDAARDREEIKKSLSEIARTSTNLGDYVCPYCMQTSLKAGASRCPICRGEIGGDYWNAVRARQKADAERQRAEAQAAAERQRAFAEREKALAAVA